MLIKNDYVFLFCLVQMYIFNEKGWSVPHHLLKTHDFDQFIDSITQICVPSADKRA